MIGKTISEMMAVRLWQEILLHTYELGGTTVEIFGSKGSAKTTLMLKIAEKVCYKKDDAIYPEPVIWRARLVDQWNWFEGKDIRIFVHKEDNPKFYYETGEQIYLSVKKYFDPEDILENLKKFNVVYEPTKYEISKNLVGLLARRGGVSAKTLEDVRMDS
ncbi:MAG: hypothetical protein RMH75_07500, partial [Archaeoglobaceae archaeon]|nr:hypothetical protein [Archaeoglobaceae archaeon]MDW7990484.1 hypothetical protein [Archaeoglobaceae archaeon]